MTESIAHYRIGAKLGQGAMGAVYRATDTKLGRDVAIKVLTANVGDGSAGLASIAREAQVLASLNHPNIAAIYGIEDQAIVMELVEGPTLADRIAKGALPLDEALGIARQIADALAAAHDKGIVHRDLKPGNIKLTPDGTIKLLDFGLAKPGMLMSASDETMTLAPSSSGIGMIVGTPAYMSPEQARGAPVDKRSDIWAFGVVLYEMLTGTRLFGGESTTDVIAAVVREEPDVAKVPASVRPLLRKCLEKDPKRRLRDVGDAMLLLETASEPAATAPAASAPPRVRTIGPLAVLGALVLVLGMISYVHLRETAPPPHVVRFTTTLPPNLNFTQASVFTISPDGRQIAFPAVGADGRTQLWVQSLDSLTPKPLPGVDLPQTTDTILWSPDSRFIAFPVGPPTPQIKRVALAGGPVQVTPFPGTAGSGSWEEDGTILLGSFAGILRVPLGGGAPTLISKVDAKRKELTHIWPAMLPDGKHFLYSRGGAPGTRGVFVGSLDVAADAQSTKPLLTTDFGATFAPKPGSRDQGWLMFVRDGALLAQPFDASTQTLSGEPVTVVEDVGTVNGTGAGGAYYSISHQGTLAYKTGSGVSGLRRLAWFGRDGKPVGASTELSRYGILKVSPDGTRIATSRQDAQDISRSDIWVTDVARDSSIRLTFGPLEKQQPVWSPDGTQIAWTVIRPGSPDSFYRKSADGSGTEELLYTFDSMAGPLLTDWTSDGRFLVFSRRGDVFALPVGPDSDSSRQPIPVVATPANERAAYVSPETKWVAYLSDESGRQEVYVQPFAPGWKGATPTGGKTLVSRGTLGLARWRGDGKELLFVNAEGTLMAAPVSLTPTFGVSPAAPLFELPRELLAQGRQPGSMADVSRDHQRFFFITPPPETRQGINVVLNWPAALPR